MLSSEETLSAVLLTDTKGTIISWNAGCEALFGLPAAGALQRPLSSLLAEQCRALLDAQARTEAPSRCDAAELRILRADGSTEPAELTLIPQHGADGAVTHGVAVFVAEREDGETGLVGSMPLRRVIDVLPGTFYVLRRDGSFVLWNKTLERVTALSAEELKRANALDMYDFTEKRLISAKIGEVFEQDAQVFVEADYLDKSGNGTPYLLCGARIECRGRYYLCGMGLDISQRRQQEESLRLRERALHATSNGLVITRCAGADNPIEYANPAFERITGYGIGEVIGQDARFMASAGMDEDARAELRAAIRQRREVNVLFRNRRKSGEIFWNDLTITPVTDGRGKVTHFIGVINDVTAIKQRTAHLEHEVTHDALTGLANRTLLWDRLEQAIHMAQRNKSLVAVVLVDLNGFKQINDTYGHEAGDEVLTVVAKRLQASVRESDTVARLSGDEFVLVLVNQPSLRYTLRMIERLRTGMAKAVAFGSTEIAVGASMGASVFPHDGNGALELVRAADVAMYHSKAARKNEVHFFSSDMKSTTEAKQKREDALRGAIDRHEVFLLFQPRICLNSGLIKGFEALMRWRHPQQGVLLPAAFLAEAEENGLIIPLGNCVLELACAALQHLRALGFANVTLAVNASYREFSRPHYVEHIADVVGRHGVAPGCLELELREEGLNANHHLGLEVMSQLRELGVLRTVDGFGEGMSDVNYLQRLPLNQVKIARSVVHAISAEAGGTVARILIDLGHNLGVPVIAKGVENRIQVDFLKAQRCDQMQGLFFREPVGAEALQDLLVSAPAA